MNIVQTQSNIANPVTRLTKHLVSGNKEGRETIFRTLRCLLRDISKWEKANGRTYTERSE